MKKMMHDIRYVGLSGEINFSKEPYMYQSTDLFDYNLEYDLNYFPSGKGGKVKRFKQTPQINSLTLGVINRVDVRDLVAKLERHFQADINAKKPAKLIINGSYTECYIVSSVKTFFNRFKGINFITFDILRENPVWNTEEEYAYQKVDLTLNPYDLNLIKPPYDFSQLEFTQPAKPLSEANLIPNGWDSFVPYGNEGKETKAPLEVFDDEYIRNYLTLKNVELGSISYATGGERDETTRLRSNVFVPVGSESELTYYSGGSDFEISLRYYDVQKEFLSGNTQWNGDGVVFALPKETKYIKVVTRKKDDSLLNDQSLIGSNMSLTTSKASRYLAWEDIPEKDKPVRAWDNMAVHMTPLENGLTRIQTWGGSNLTKIRTPLLLDIGVRDFNYTLSMLIKDNFSDIRLHTNFGLSGESEPSGPPFAIDVPEKYNGMARLFGIKTGDIIRLMFQTKNINDNLDFIASTPTIVENDGSMIYDIQEYNDKYHITTLNSHSKTKAQLPVKTSIFRNEQYTHSIEAENKGESDVIITSEKDTYIDNPLVEVKPNEKGTFKYTGTVAKDKLYTNMEFATKEVEDELNLIVSKPAIRYGDKPFDWPPEEEIVPLRIPSQVPFWITADDSIKYISNNSIGDTLAKITMFGAIKNPTLYIGSNTYRVYEELLDNERIEIDQRNKTVVKITASGERVNVFHLRDKEHSVFKPIPEGENLVTQNDDFSYTVVLYHERNEPKWS